VAGDVRNHVSMAELDEWADRLERRGVHLQILRTDSRMCELESDELESAHAHISRMAHVRFNARTEWEQLQVEVSRLDGQVAWETLTRHSCGERLRAQDRRSAFRTGDIVYHTPRVPVSDVELQHCVAVITHVHSRCCGEVDDRGKDFRLPTGELTLLRWDASRRDFISPMVTADYGGDRDWTLLPPCCGRGAACPQLALTLPAERQWPNELETLPEAFRAWMQNAVPEHRLEAQLKPFKRLLGLVEPRPLPSPSSSPLPTPPRPPPPLPQPTAAADDDEISICDEPPDPPSPTATPCDALAAAPAAPTAPAAAPATAPAAAPTAAPADTPCWWMDLPSDLEAKIAAETDRHMSMTRRSQYTRAEAEAFIRQLVASNAGYGPQRARGCLVAKPYGLSMVEWLQQVDATAEREWRERLARGIHRIDRE
jgi:hypothetical protein